MNSTQSATTLGVTGRAFQVLHLTLLALAACATSADTSPASQSPVLTDTSPGVGSIDATSATPSSDTALESDASAKPDGDTAQHHPDAVETVAAFVCPRTGNPPTCSPSSIPVDQLAVSGSVRDANSFAPIPAALVSTEPSLGTTTANSDGDYVFLNTAPPIAIGQEYRVTATAPGYAPNSAFVTTIDGHNAHIDILLTPAATECGADEDCSTGYECVESEERASGVCVDSCETWGWYGDGTCETFCPQADPDCEGCPDCDAVYETCVDTLCVDYCDYHGYYGDGACDDWCYADPDCNGTTDSNYVGARAVISVPVQAKDVVVAEIAVSYDTSLFESKPNLELLGPMTSAGKALGDGNGVVTVVADVAEEEAFNGPAEILALDFILKVPGPPVPDSINLTYTKVTNASTLATTTTTGSLELTWHQ